MTTDSERSKPESGLTPREVVEGIAEAKRMATIAERNRIVAFLRRPVYRGMWTEVANAIEEGQHHE